MRAALWWSVFVQRKNIIFTQLRQSSSPIRKPEQPRTGPARTSVVAPLVPYNIEIAYKSHLSSHICTV